VPQHRGAGTSSAMPRYWTRSMERRVDGARAQGDDDMSRRTLSIILLAMAALLFAGTSAATAAAKPTKKKPVTRTVVRPPPQPLDTQTGSRSQGM
jgi:hypothetical protein